MKRIAQAMTSFLAVFVLLQSSAGADWSSAVSGSNPLNWYRFNELTGTAATDSGSGGLNGIFTGGYTLAVPTPLGSGVSFNGTNGYVNLGGASLTGDWTVESIFKADTVRGSVSMGLMGADFAATSNRVALKAEQWNSTERLGYTLFGVTDVTFTNAAAATPANFEHVVFVAKSTGVSLYVNGALAASDSTAAPLSRWILGAGARQADGTLVDPLYGVIDELVIYNRALPASEILAHAAVIPEPGVISLALLGALTALVRARRR